MKTLIAALAIMASSQSFAATAYFTGNVSIVTTVTGQTGYNCEYSYAGQVFWLVFPEYYPLRSKFSNRKLFRKTWA